jgi:hypothetical protein
MTEREEPRTDRPDVAGDPGGETIPADETVEGLGEVQISGEAEEDAPTGGAAPPSGHGG